MAVYYVDYLLGNDSSGTGATGAPWKTPAKALTVVTSGDVVKFRGSKTDSTTFYPTPWNANVAGVTWQNDTGHTPTWYGAYTPTGGNYALGSSRPGKQYSAMIAIDAHNTTLSGLRVQNVGGVGYSIAKNAAGDGIENAVITHCESYLTYSSALVLSTSSLSNRVKNAEISYCTFSDISYSVHDPDRNGDDVQGNCQLLYCEDTHFHHNTLCYGFGEGTNIGKGSTRTIYEYNTVHTMDHVHIAIVRCVECDVRYNTVYHTKHPDFVGGNYGIPDGIRIGDETGCKMVGLPNSAKQRIYGNLIIGGADLLSIANGSNFDTQLNEAYIGYNTFIGEVARPEVNAPKTKNCISLSARKPAYSINCNGNSVNIGGPGHTKTIVENNLFYAPPGVPLGNVAGASGITFRNNLWYSADGEAIPTAARVTSNVTANPLLVDPTKRINDVYPATSGTGYAVGNYRPTKNSPAIGAASNRQPVNNLTPPTITVDLSGTIRSDLDTANLQYFDIGALEFGTDIVDTDTDSVTAAFTQSATQGVAPLAVIFTSTSTDAGAAAIDDYTWNLGDGITVNNQSPLPYIYSEPGTYTPTLTVRDTVLNLSDVKTGSPITITAPPTGDEPGVFDVVRTAMPAVTGLKTILFNLGGHAPALVLLFLSKATTAGIAVDDAMLSVGAATSTEQWCYVLNSNDTADPTSGDKYTTLSACVVSLDGGAVTGVASLSTLAADKIVLNITDAFPGGVLLTAVAFAGAQYKATAREFMLGVQNSETILAPDFLPEWYLFGGNIGRNLDGVETYADFTMSMANATAGYGYSWREVHGAATSSVKAIVSVGDTTDAIRQPAGSGYAAFTDYTNGKLQVFLSDISRRFLYAALDTPTSTTIAVKRFASPTSTGNQSYDCGMEPVGVLGLFTLIDQLNGGNVASANAEGFAIVAADAGAVYGLAIASQTGAAAANSKSLATNNVKVISGDGTTMLEGDLTLTATGFDIDWTTVQGTARYFHITAISGTPSVSGPIPRFEADDTTPENGIVQFTDLSGPNGAAITAWYWDFGDNSFSTEQNPAHTYREPGTYTVALTVTNTNGTETKIMAGYIRYIAQTRWMIGPYESLPLTEDSEDRLYGDDPAHPHYGFHSHATDFGAMELDAYPEDMTSASGKPGKARLLLDKDAGTITVIWPDGTIDTWTKD